MPGSTKCGTYQKKNTRSFLGDYRGGKRNKEDGGGGGEERRHKDLEEGRFPSPAPDFGGGLPNSAGLVVSGACSVPTGVWPRAGMRTLRRMVRRVSEEHGGLSSKPALCQELA